MAARSVDQRVLGAGTTVRFGLLLALLLAASASAISDFLARIADPNNDGFGCILASGGDPSGDWLAALLRPISTGADTALGVCVKQHVDFAPWWAPMLGIGVLLAVAGAFFWGIPAWRG